MTRAGRFAVVAVGVLAVLAGVLGLVLNLSAPLSRVEQPTRVSQLIYLCQPLLLGSLGCYLAVRRSRHPAGWLMLVAGVAADGPVQRLAAQMLHSARESRPADSRLRSSAGLCGWRTGPGSHS